MASEFSSEFIPEQQIEHAFVRLQLVPIDRTKSQPVTPHVDRRTPEEIAQRIQEHNNFIDNIDSLEPIPEIKE